MYWIRTFGIRLYDNLFGCPHQHLSRPFTLENESYKVCLRCGRHLAYCAQQMRLLSRRELRRNERLRLISIPKVITMPASRRLTIARTKIGHGTRPLAR